MAQHFDEFELLALIEGELSDADAAGLRGRLATDPRLLASVDELITHRQATRSLQTPALPCDFVAELEPMLVRSMLVETSPGTSNGQYVPGQARRAKRSALTHPGVIRYATAAGLVIAATAGLWAAGAGLGLLGGSANSGGEHIADSGSVNPAIPDENTLASRAGANETSALLWADDDDASSQIHHELTLDTLLASAGSSSSSSSGTTPPKLAALTPTRIAADFALLLENDQTDRAEMAMIASLQPRETSTALVRNFSFEDATALETQWHATRRNEPRLRRPATASLGSPEATRVAEKFFRELASRATSQLRTLRASSSDANATQKDGVLAGSQDLAADTTQQLRYSSAGATHTMSVPVRDLGSVLMNLTDADIDSQAMLTMFQPMNILDDPIETKRASDLNSAERIRRMLEVRAALDALLASDPNAIVLLPIVVQTDD